VLPSDVICTDHGTHWRRHSLLSQDRTIRGHCRDHDTVRNEIEISNDE
jgi:hypothetical protein